MKLLIVTQIVDTQDPALGFFVSWIEKFARECESVEVICLREGAYTLPANVRVHSLGKENGPASRMTYAWRFLSLAWRLRRQYDSVFVHMNHEYLVIAGWLWRVLDKRTGLWYLHKSVTRSLRIGVRWADIVFTASRESFRLPTAKLQIVGHGVDMVPLPKVPAASGELRLVSLGRISESKGIREVLAALDILHTRGVSFTYTIVGSPVTMKDKAYEQALTYEIACKPYTEAIRFAGPVPHAAIPRILSEADVFVHLSDTGSLDKAALEALLAGVPVVTSNDSIKTLVPQEWCVDRHDAGAVADAIRAVRTADMSAVVERVRSEHDLAKLVPRLTMMLMRTGPTARNLFVMRSLLRMRDILCVVPMFREVSVLCYHSIGGEADTAVSAETFARHLALLTSSGAEFVSIDALIAWRQGKGELPWRATVVTFDDGYADFMSVALPILEKYGVPACVFVVGNPLAARRYMGNEIPLLNTEQIAQLSSHPLITIGYHSLSHANPMDPATDATKECAPHYGAKIFAYPGGKYTDVYIGAVEAAGYTAAFSIKPDLVTPHTGVYLLPRSVVVKATPDWMVRYYTTRAVAWYRTLRRSLIY